MIESSDLLLVALEKINLFLDDRLLTLVLPFHCQELFLSQLLILLCDFFVPVKESSFVLGLLQLLGELLHLSVVGLQFVLVLQLLLLLQCFRLLDVILELLNGVLGFVMVADIFAGGGVGGGVVAAAASLRLVPLVFLPLQSYFNASFGVVAVANGQVDVVEATRFSIHA